MKQMKISTAIAIIILAMATTVPATLMVYISYLDSKQASFISMEDEFGKLSEIKEIIDDKYVGNADEEQAIDYAAAGYVSGIGDKWSYYLSQEQYKQYKEDAKEDLVGIGVNVVYDSEREGILITNVYPDSPAIETGLLQFDLITEVDGTPVSEVGYTEAVDMVRGLEGTKVTLTIEREEKETQVFTLTRRTVKKVSVIKELIGTVGHIEITDFDSDTANQFKVAIAELQTEGATSFIFDVRNNPGGYLSTLVDILDYILPEGDIISTVNIEGEETVYASDADAFELPYVVLVNESSISAAEFFAAAIQDYNLATIIGTKTGGKGYTQQIIELSDGSAINLSTNKYYTPNGESLAETGITPDITIELSEEEYLNFHYLDENTDPQLKKAIEELTTPKE